MKVEEEHTYRTGKYDAEGYIDLSEVTVGIFAQSRKGLYCYTKDQVGTIYKVYSDYTQQMVDTRTYYVFGSIDQRQFRFLFSRIKKFMHLKEMLW